MNFVNQLTDEELTEIFKMFMASNGTFVSLDIDRFDDSIELSGRSMEPDDEYPGEELELEDSYSLTDFNVAVYTHSGGAYCQKQYREWMYKKFKSKYAKAYLLGHM